MAKNCEPSVSGAPSVGVGLLGIRVGKPEGIVGSTSGKPVGSSAGKPVGSWALAVKIQVVNCSNELKDTLVLFYSPYAKKMVTIRRAKIFDMLLGMGLYSAGMFCD